MLHATISSVPRMARWKPFSDHHAKIPFRNTPYVINIKLVSGNDVFNNILQFQVLPAWDGNCSKWKSEKNFSLTGWMEKPTLDAVLELLACCCTRPCKLPNCVCLANGLKCTDIYTLKECQNQVEDDEEIVLYNSDDDTDDS